ncbi:pilus assembly protein TadB [Caldovatus sediminis]|uniref:Pilus assembly protein TadB n=1 Tax=Caldovatus sediminis TaxID=2041189 RepID=A0A8J2ZE85_9PROT|nr:type II secretion system F family protein [Caldovatus sediminis]GGG43611.1 pilus assembly protein TadB [Caldovatus sediminis]
MNADPSLLFAAAFALLLFAGAVALFGAAGNRRMKERVRAAGVGAQEAQVPAASAVPSIRLAAPTENRVLALLIRMVGYSPEVPQAQIIPWPAVVVAGLGTALLAYWRARGWLGPLGAAPLGLLAGGFVVRLIFRWQHRRYSNALFGQIPDALGLIIRAIRAGLPMGEALRSVSREMPAPTKDEFARLVGEIAIGRPIDQAIWRVYERSGITEYAFLSVTLGLQSQTGGSLAETLENLADLVRKRVAMAQRASALAAEAKASAVILVILPFICVAIMTLIRPNHLSTFFTDPAGYRMMMVGLVLMGLGVLTIRWLIRRAQEG